MILLVCVSHGRMIWDWRMGQRTPGVTFASNDLDAALAAALHPDSPGGYKQMAEPALEAEAQIVGMSARQFLLCCNRFSSGQARARSCLN